MQWGPPPPMLSWLPGDGEDVEAPVVEELHDALVPLVADEFVVADAEEVGAEHADLGVVALNKL